MTNSPDEAAFVHVVQTVYSQVAVACPLDEKVAEEQLEQGFSSFGLTMTTEVVGALAFAAVHQAVTDSD